MPGELHAVLGENGAGKSTLMKIIYGAVRPDEGALAWNGAPVAIHNPRQARALGIAMVFQHFALFETLTVAENVWLGIDKTMTRAEVAHEVERVSGLYGLELEAGRLVSSLSVGERQRVEILRALLTNPQLLILDEPTAVLTPQMAERLFVTLAPAGRRGVLDRLHQPQARRGARALHALHGAASRSRGRLGRSAPRDQPQPVGADARRGAAGTAGARGAAR